MERRKFLHQTVAAGFATGFALSLAPLIPRPQREEEVPPPESCTDRIPAPPTDSLSPRGAWRIEQLAAAWRRAAHAGRPLLLIVVPTDPTTRSQQAGAWGEAITHGDDAFIAALLGAELACATSDEITAFLPGFDERSPEPTAVCVDVCALPATWQAARVALLHGERYSQEDDAAITARIDTLTGAISALLPSPQPASPDAEAIEARRKAVIPGSRWGSSWGCGEDFETPDPLIPEPSWGVDCGMGHVNPRSRRFLDFLTREPPEEGAER